MRFRTILGMILGLNRTRILSVGIIEDKGLILDVEPTTRIPRCSGCNRKVREVHDRYRGRTWRHLDLAGTWLELRYDIKRVCCRKCGVRVERVPWAAVGSKFTEPFEDQVGYLAQNINQTAVAELMRITWRTVGEVARRVVERHGPEDPFEGLTRIGVDELSYRRHHKYITTVVDHVRGHVVWAREGKSSDTLKAFFEELGPERCAAIEFVTLDMSAAYIKAVSEMVPTATLVFDRFHVQRLVQDALDEVRREEVRQAPGAPASLVAAQSA